MKASTFDDRLAVSVTLTAGGTAHAIPPGDVKSFELDLRAWGFEGRVDFLVADNAAVGGLESDALKAAFLEPDLLEVALELKAVQTDAATQPAITPVKVKGLVVERSLVELPAAPQPGTPLLFRRYGVRFVDAARLLWGQHHPVCLYTQKTVQDVLDAHKGEKVSLTYDWQDGLGTTHAQLFLGLPPEDGASFYDFLIWYVHTRNGVLAWDYTAQGLSLSAAKAASGTPVDVLAPDVDTVALSFPEVPRHEMAVLNAVAEGAATTPIANTQAVTGIRQDVLLRTSVADEVDARVTLETARLKVPGMEVELGWRRFPAAALAPGTLVKLPSAEAWSATGLAAGGTYRVRHLHVRGEALKPGPDAAHLEPHAGFHFSMATRLERQEETWVDLPPYTPPRWPRYVEGTIVSEVGEEADETWQAYTDSATSLDGYRVKVPLWEDQVITVPFNPHLLPGHFYFPAYKGQRVLVALDFQKAWLKRFLDWRDGARMPADGQGVHLMVGKTAQSGTSLKHSYTDGKPVFLLQRTNAKDTARIEIKEGTLLIHVEEEQA
ncbi:hypothetical protein [Pyxidicoccus sp. MSG2]|uniref:hypothetical protein n=1 Tax=Pyxidicoccus sp. MSG2 TaxID=2996790 RepID=UPI00227131CE|nr:hypothetical protein [Pyxidicoccus sp. MSG2]MCY1022802.1 hypothetical protein [Pyxidicoccus sp. MSG2]